MKGVPRADLVEQESCVVTGRQVEERAACTAQRQRVSSRPRHRVWLDKDAMMSQVRLSSQYASIVNRELVNLPEEGTNGERGRSRVQLTVTEDGTLMFLGSPFNSALCRRRGEQA